MNLNIPDMDPFILGYIKHHQAEHGHKNQREAVACLISQAMSTFVKYKKCIHMTDRGCELKMLIPCVTEDDIKTCDVHMVGICTTYTEDGVHTFTAI